MNSNSDLIKRSLLGEADALPSDFPVSELKDLWVNEFSSTSLSGRFLCWIISSEDIKGKEDLLIFLFESCRDPGAFTTVAQMLSQGNISSTNISDKHFLTLLGVISDQSKFHGLRGQALLVCTLVAIENPIARRKLRSYLFNILPDGDGRYLRYLAASIGMLASHINMEEAEEHLILLKVAKEAAEEASLQLGFQYLAKGLDCSERNVAIANFEKAYNEFYTSGSLGEGRPDAKMLSLCLKILLQFYKKVPTNTNEMVEDFNDVAFEYSALLVDSSDTSSLIGCRTEEAFRWMLFASRLSLLQKSFEEDAWLEAARVIEEQLFFIYCAQRSIFKKDNEGGITSIIQPIISGHLQENRFQLVTVQAWLDKVDEIDRNKDWNNIYSSLGEELESSIQRTPKNIVESVTRPIKNTLDDAVKEGLGEEYLSRMFAESSDTFRRQLPSPAISALNKKLFEFIKSCDKSDDIIIHNDASVLFYHLIPRIYDFLTCRINSPSSKVKALRYLHSDFDDIVKEEHLQDDLFEFFQTGMPSVNIMYEPRKHSGGRSDILINYINVNTVIELKKIDKRMTNEEILKAYGPQASTYQVANSNFCFLGVLDNFDAKGLQVDLRDSFSCHHWSPKLGKTRYSVIIFRIQGKRRSPSELSKRTKKSLKQ